MIGKKYSVQGTLRIIVRGGGGGGVIDDWYKK